MSDTFFVEKNSIVRKIWGKADTILFIFAGAAAEFALNKAVDWLYFTGKLPADPIGRLFSTVTYARQIVFAKQEDAIKAIDKITAIHSAVEAKRKATIPDWAYRDVLYMLIHFSISSFEVLERKLSPEEKEEVYNVFYRMGDRMGLEKLPLHYEEWIYDREYHLQNDLAYSTYTKDLFKQYKKALGAPRYIILIEAMLLVIPDKVRELMHWKKSRMKPMLATYKFTRFIKLDWFLKLLLLPSDYKQQIKDLDVH